MNHFKREKSEILQTTAVKSRHFATKGLPSAATINCEVECVNLRYGSYRQCMSREIMVPRFARMTASRMTEASVAKEKAPLNKGA